MFKFTSNTHADLVFAHEEKSHNWGYNYNLRLFPMLWIYHKQVTGKNIFDRFKTPQGTLEGLEYFFKQDLEETMDSYKNLPSSREYFNSQLRVLKFCGFGMSGGTNINKYSWELREDNLLHLTVQNKVLDSREEVLSLSSETDSIFLKDYLKFLKGCPQMGACYDRSCGIINELKKV